LLNETPRGKLSGRGLARGLALALGLLVAAGLPALAQGVQLKFTDKNVDDGTLGLAYKDRIRVTGGVAPYRWRLAGGALPPGLNLNRKKGIIKGIPASLGTFTFTVRVIDATGARQSRDFTITVGDQTELVERVSVSSTGEQANSDSGGAALSPDGRFVAFTSFADNLVLGDKNASPDVFLRDRTCAATIRASVRSDGTEGKSQSFAPAVSDAVGGVLFVAYASDARNLVPGDKNRTRDIFVTAVDVSSCPPSVIDTARVSLAVDGSEKLGVNHLPVISADGRFVALQSGADLVGGGTQGFNVFLVEIQFSGGVITPVQVQRISTAKLPLPVQLMINLGDTTADITGNKTIGNSALTMAVDEHAGRLVKIVAGTGAGQSRLIESNDATTLTLTANWNPDLDNTSVFRIVTGNQTADLFSASTIGQSALAMTANEHAGRTVEIVAGTSRNQRRLITANDATTLTVSPDWNTTPDDTSKFRVLTFDDLPVDVGVEDAVANFSLTMTPLEFNNRLIQLVAGTGAGQMRPIQIHDAMLLASSPDWDPVPDATTTFRIVTQTLTDSFRPRMSAGGGIVAYHSSGVLVDEDTNGLSDVYVSDPATGITSLESMDSAGVPGNRASLVSAVNSDGSLVLFHSEATNRVPDDTNKVADLFLHDRTTGATTRVSLADDETEGDAAPDVNAGLSGGGNLVAFDSFATNLVPGDRNNARDVFLRDIAAGTTRRLSLGLGGINPDGESFDPAISLDGTTVAFSSLAKNLVLNDTNKNQDVFVVTTGISDPPLIILSKLAQPQVGSPYSASLVAAGGTRPLFWTLSEGALPPGLFLDPSTGQISGLPQRAGSYTFTVLVMDSARPTRQASRAVTLVVKP